MGMNRSRKSDRRRRHDFDGAAQHHHPLGADGMENLQQHHGGQRHSAPVGEGPQIREHAGRASVAIPARVRQVPAGPPHRRPPSRADRPNFEFLHVRRSRLLLIQLSPRVREGARPPGDTLADLQRADVRHHRPALLDGSSAAYEAIKPKPCVATWKMYPGARSAYRCKEGGGRSDICRPTMLLPSPSGPWQVAQVMS